jgi:hypothetical protein
MILLALWLGCVGGGQAEEARQPTLAEVTFEVTHEAVGRLGPHRHIAVIEREERMGDAPSTRTTETVEILWGGWDDFALRRLQGGLEVSSRMVLGGRAWVRKKGNGWQTKGDAEPLRVKFRTSWDTWDEAMELFSSRVALVPGADGVMEGRPVQSHALMLSEPPAHVGAGRRARQGGVTALAGTIVVDKATGVRLRTEVVGTHQRGSRVRTVSFMEERTGFGVAPDLASLLEK